MMTVVELLKAGQELISVPERWTQGVAARDANGVPINPRKEDACCWCSYGALLKVSDDAQLVYSARGFLNRAIGVLDDPIWPGVYFVKFQESHTHAEVLAMWNRAIALAEAGSAVTA